MLLPLIDRNIPLLSAEHLRWVGELLTCLADRIEDENRSKSATVADLAAAE
jgi:hypothetical protein